MCGRVPEKVPGRLELGAPLKHGAKGVTKRLEGLRAFHSLAGDRLLDVGCGNGSYTIVLATRFREVHAIDIEPDRLNELRQTAKATSPSLPISVHEMSAESLEFPANYFDVVTAIEVMEHIGNLNVALREVARVLRPGGTFLVTCPNRWFPLEGHAIRTRSGRLVDGRVFPLLPYFPPLRRRLATARNFSAREVRTLLAPVGLTHIGTTYVMPPFDEWQFGARFIRPITDILERTPLRRLGVSIVAGYIKPELHTGASSRP